LVRVGFLRPGTTAPVITAWTSIRDALNETGDTKRYAEMNTNINILVNYTNDFFSPEQKMFGCIAGIITEFVSGGIYLENI